MIVTRAPLRISFLGGGSDYIDFFGRRTGYVLGTTINKYVYVNIMTLPNFAEENFRFTYRVTESVNQIEDFNHPVMKTALKRRNWKRHINVATMADLPGRSGLGSSSSFTVALELALSTFQGESIKPDDLARVAIEIERIQLGEPGGLQDQYQASFGGLNLYEFSKRGTKVIRNEIQDEILTEISKSLVLAPTHKLRDSSKYAALTVEAINRKSEFEAIGEMADRSKKLFDLMHTSKSSSEVIEKLSQEINWGWEKKLWISRGSIDFEIDDLIKRGLQKGALAGRMCGAGGTGFILFIVDPTKRLNFINGLGIDDAFPVEIEQKGCSVILAQHD